MGKNTRWIAIVAFFFVACAALKAAPVTHKKPPKKPVHRVTHHYRHYRHYHRRYYRRRIRLPRGPSPERVTQIQTALKRGGYYTGEPNGRWDANTVAAVQKFQSTHNLDATGKLDAPTLQKLGLGSAIAGVAAPKPVLPKDCCTAGPAVPKPAAKGKVTPGAATSASAASPQPSGADSHKSVAESSSSATSTAAIAPSVNPSTSGTSSPASAAKPDAAQH